MALVILSYKRLAQSPFEQGAPLDRDIVLLSRSQKSQITKTSQMLTVLQYCSVSNCKERHGAFVAPAVLLAGGASGVGCNRHALVLMLLLREKRTELAFWLELMTAPFLDERPQHGDSSFQNLNLHLHSSPVRLISMTAG